MFHPINSEVTEKEKRWTYQLGIVFNDQEIIRVTITDYYQKNHPDITNELVMELLTRMNGEELKPTKYDGKRKPYLWEKDYNNKRYRLIFWFKDHTDKLVD